MTHNATGTVTRLTTRNFTSKAGKPLTSHGVVLDTGAEFELKGFKQLHRIGDRVEYSVAKEYGRLTAVGPAVPGQPPLASGGSSSSAPASGGSNSRESRKFPVPPDSGEVAIIRQNALTNAVNLVNNLMGEDSDLALDDAAVYAEARADLAIKIAYKFQTFATGRMDQMAGEEMARIAKGVIAGE